jgi:hypothetical protein
VRPKENLPKYHCMALGCQLIEARGLGRCWGESGRSVAVHYNENPIYVFPEKELRGLSPKFQVLCVCERFIYSQDRSTYFPAAE